MRAVRRTWSREPWERGDAMWFGVEDDADELAGLDTLEGLGPGDCLVQQYDNGQTVIFTRKPKP